MAKVKSSKISARQFSLPLLVLSLLMLLLGVLALWANQFVSGMVRSELAAQKIYFPPKGSPALDPATYPDLQKYAGQLVDTPEKAKAYANGFIARHLQKVAGGKVYAEVSAEAAKDPSNQKLQQQKATLFQGETLRGILLTSGYGFGMVGKIAGIAAYGLFTLGTAGLLAVVLMRFRN